MQNATIAQIFDEIADLMEVAGQNSFKIRAYRRAAEAVATYNAPIEDAAEAGTLQEIDGLGEATSQKIREYLATGTVRYLDRLRDEYPATLLELLRVPNLGPKRIAQLYREKGISSVEDLVEALNNNGLQGLSGFGPKTIETIRRGLARMAEVTQRLPLGNALPVAASLTQLIAASGTVARVEVAGSLRRGCDTVGNLNIVVETNDAPAAIAEYVGLPMVLSVGQRSEAEATVRVRPGIDAHLRCAAPEAFGAGWLYTTGASRHFEQAQQRARELGLELTPQGLFRAGTRIAGETEEEIYQALGVPFIPPELREGAGEWAAATAGALPKLVQVADIRGDLHTHSTWSDGVVTIREMATAMQARGYSYFAVTDHSKALAMANGLNAERLRAQAIEIAEAQAEFPNLKILRGVECDIMRDGSLDLDDDILHELDVVVASVHSAFTFDEATQTQRMIRALSHPAVDIVAHPTGRVLGRRPGYEVNIAALIEAARDTGTALEINASERLDLSDTNARAAREAGALLAVDSDAHSPRMLPNIDLGVLTARRAWCSAGDLLNTKSTDELMAWLKRPQAQK
jgi:DNA polymerase (family 10)